MEPFFIFLSIALTAVAFVLAYLHHLHMFQLNSYHFDVEMKWIAKNPAQCLVLFLPCLAVLLLTLLMQGKLILLRGILSAALLSGLVIYLGYRKATKKAKKPLVYTDRVKRMMVTSFVLFFAPVIVTCFINGKIALIYGICAVALMPLYVLLVNFINKPVEGAVKQYYINDAKKLLAANKDLKIIGITGSYGKTSTKYYLHTLLSEKYDVLMTPGSYNTPMGVVKTIRSSLRATHEVFICEMGAKYVGDIKELCEIVDPEIGLITSIGAQHLDTFGSLENIVKTKLELADFINDQNVFPTGIISFDDGQNNLRPFDRDQLLDTFENLSGFLNRQILCIRDLMYGARDSGVIGNLDNFHFLLLCEK